MGYALRSPTETTAPVAGTTAGLYTITPGCTALTLTNTTGQIAYLIFNTATAASATVYDLPIESRETGWTLRAADLGLPMFDLLGVWIPSGGDVTKFKARCA